MNRVMISTFGNKKGVIKYLDRGKRHESHVVYLSVYNDINGKRQSLARETDLQISMREIRTLDPEKRSSYNMKPTI